eukprot:345411-Pyramimonas_sp.AAC.1
MILPFDGFEASFDTMEAGHTLDIDADDITLQVVAAPQHIVEESARIIQRLAVVLRAMDLHIAKDKAKTMPSAPGVARQAVGR